jgi:hypothetical protein
MPLHVVWSAFVAPSSPNHCIAVPCAAGLYRGVRANTEQTCLVRLSFLVPGGNEVRVVIYRRTSSGLGECAVAGPETMWAMTVEMACIPSAFAVLGTARGWEHEPGAGTAAIRVLLAVRRH